LNIQKGGTYIDFTFGGGGHSAGILEHLGNGRLIAFDQDPAAQKNAMKDERFLFIRGNFRYVRNYLRFHDIASINGALADLGISSHQIDVAERGFSFRHDSKIDMRMNPGSSMTAANVLNTYTEEQLRDIFRSYGELRNAGKLATEICRLRKTRKLETAKQLLGAIEKCLPERNRQKYLAKVFQAIRIEVNEELESLEEMLVDAGRFIVKGGRFVIITYHSLEDRMVKNFFRSGHTDGMVRKDMYGNVERSFLPVNKNVIRPGTREIETNPRARSAKLRIAEKQTADA
jgi:16S rRNA (cytosine1402-N4)-methyltransferase